MSIQQQQTAQTKTTLALLHNTNIKQQQALPQTAKAMKYCHKRRRACFQHKKCRKKESQEEANFQP
jgi:hypothetical protein